MPRSVRPPGKPTRKSTASAAKPTSKHTVLWTRHAEKSTVKTTASASKPSALDEYRHAKNDAISSYESHQTRLLKMSEEMQVVWFTVFDSRDAPATLRVSWRSCWGRLESILMAIFLDCLQGRSVDLSEESREKLTNVLEALKAKVTLHHHQSVLQNQLRALLECFTNLTQKTSDVSTWHTILDELLCNTTSSSVYRTTEAGLIEQHLDRANRSLR